MRRLLEIEYYKIRYHKASLRMLICYFILFPMLIFLSAIEVSFGSLTATLGELNVLDFPLIWHFGTYTALYLKFLLILIIVTSVTGEYSHNTLKQNLIDGLSKKEFLMSKISMTVVLSVLSVFISFISFLFIGWKNSPELDWSLVFSELDYFLGYFVRLLGFLMFGIFSAVLLRRSALALGFMVIWRIAEGFIGLILKKTLGAVGITIAGFLPFTSMNNVVSQPFQRIGFVKAVSSQLGQQIDFMHGVHYIPMLQSLVWIVIFMLLSYKILLSRDL